MRLVIKIGTSLLVDGQYRLDLDFLRNFAEKVAAIKQKGHEIVIVSSGAVASGRSELRFECENKNIPCRQVLAAVGQGLLMKIYYDFFKKRGIAVAQALLTNYDFVNRENFLNTKNVFELLLKRGIVPIVNENDVTAVAELKFGDNDMLSAKTAAMVSADCLCIFTDVDGFFEEDPKNNPGAKLIPVVKKIDDAARRSAGGTCSLLSLGGMITKLEAAQYVTSAGIPMFILNGASVEAFEKLMKFCDGDFTVADKIGTFFPSG